MAEFYLDHDVPDEIAVLLQASGHGAITARQLGTDSHEDDQHLLLAANRGWIFVTCNVKDFLLLHHAWRRWTAAWNVVLPHPGIIVVHQPLHWPAQRSAREILDLIETHQSLSDRYFRWRDPRGWVVVE